MKLEELLKTLSDIEPSNELHEKIMKRVNEIPKLATLGTTLGDVRIQRKDTTAWEMANPGDVMFPGDQLKTNEGGKTFIMFKDGTQVWLNQNTTLEFSSSMRKIFIPLGEILAFVTNRTKQMGKFVVGTPAGLVEVLGTEFDTTVSKEKITILTVLEGLVNFKNDRGETKVKKNSQSRANQDTKPTLPLRIDTTQITSWTGDLVNQTKPKEWYIPKRLTRKESKENQPLNLKLVIILFIAAGILGYLLGYLYGKF